MEEEPVAEFVPWGTAFGPDPGDLRKILTDAMASIGYADPALISVVYNLMQEIGQRAFDVNVGALNIQRQKLAQQGEAMRKRQDDLRQSYNLILSMVSPLISKLELGPFDEIVSVAIRNSLGEVRVVNVGSIDGDE